jgi:hypothetical protein
MNPPVVDPASPGIPTSRFPFLLITNQETSGRARYDSLQVRLSRRLSGGLLLDTSYVFSKALDNASGPKSAIRFTRWALPDARTNVTDPYSWARSSFDRRHAFVASYTYYIPGLSGDRILARLSRGWVIGGLTQVLSGKPIEIQVPAGRLSSFSHRRPDLVGAYRRLDPRRETTFRINGTSRNGHFFFDPTAFDVVTVGEQGTLGRNVLDGPGLNSTSISIARRTRVFRSQEIELRADIVNLFNQVNFGDPGLAWGTSNFGVVYSSLNPRTIQLSLRYRF